MHLETLRLRAPRDNETALEMIDLSQAGATVGTIEDITCLGSREGTAGCELVAGDRGHEEETTLESLGHVKVLVSLRRKIMKK